MSRTRKTVGGKSPIRKYVTFSGSTGLLKYYDKDLSENVELDSLDIIVLDNKYSITGYNENKSTGITSNMISDISSDELKVVSFVGNKPISLGEGLYKDIKDSVKTVGGKFTTNVLCLADFGDGFEMTNVQLAGVALGGWINFLNDCDKDAEYNNLITLTKGVLSKRGGEAGNVPVTPKEEKALDAKLSKNPRAPRPVWYYVLNVSIKEALSVTQSDLAIEQDEVLQNYFDAQNESNVNSGDTTSGTESLSQVDDDLGDDLPF